MDAHQAAVNPGRPLVGAEHFLGVPVLGVVERQPGLGGDQVRLNSDVGDTVPLCSRPRPHVAEHAAVERQHESVVEYALGPKRTRLPPSPRERLCDVLELNLIEVGAGSHEVWDESLQVLLLERCGPGGFWTDGPCVERRKGWLVGCHDDHCSRLDRLRL
jgi:hypothetical protein